MQRRSLWSAMALALLLGLSQGPALGQGAPSPGASQEELLFWDTIKNSANPADFQEYLKQYPNGRFAGLARIRARSASGAPRAPTSAAAAASIPAGPAVFPAVGESWKYRFLDRQYSPRHPLQYEVRVVKADGGIVTEALAPVGGTAKESTLKVSELTFLPRPLPNTKLAMEFSPYWIWRDAAMPTPLRLRSGSGYPLDRNTAEWQVDITSTPASVTVPAGIFSTAIKVELKGSRQTSQEMTRRGEIGRFQVTAWYAKEAGRLVKMEHRAWSAGGTPAGDEVIELLEHNKDAAAAPAPAR